MALVQKCDGTYANMEYENSVMSVVKTVMALMLV